MRASSHHVEPVATDTLKLRVSLGDGNAPVGEEQRLMRFWFWFWFLSGSGSGSGLVLSLVLGTSKTDRDP